MKCAIYRSSKKDELYLYVREKDNFDDVPEEIIKQMGKNDFVMELELSADKPLAREDVTEVMKNLRERGFHIQMPPNSDSLAWWKNEKLDKPDSPSRFA